MESIDFLTQYYSSYDEDGRLASRHGQVEFLTTMRYIEMYLAPGMKILEIGAGTGRYSHALARMGYEVTAVELVQYNLDILNFKTLPGEKITAIQGNALNMSFLPDEAYDMTFVLGPMYHLYTEADQRLALSEALRVTKRGGLFYAAYCIADAAIIQYGFYGGNIHELIDKGLLVVDEFGMFGADDAMRFVRPYELFKFCRKEDIDALLCGLPVSRLHYAATDLFALYNREALDAMDDATFELYMKYHFFLCERPDFAGMTNHSLDIMRKL